MYFAGKRGAEDDPDEDIVEGKLSDQAVLLGLARDSW